MAEHTRGNGWILKAPHVQNAQGSSVRPIKGNKKFDAQLHIKVEYQLFISLSTLFSSALFQPSGE